MSLYGLCGLQGLHRGNPAALVFSRELGGDIAAPWAPSLPWAKAQGPDEADVTVHRTDSSMSA